MKAPVPANEGSRLAALRRYEILDTPVEKDFDDLARLAAQICDTPVALVSLVDENRQWFKARVGLEVEETPRDMALCAHAIMHDELFVVRDTLADERFSSNPLVTGPPHVRFYAGVPLVDADGHAVGTVCVIDRVPRDLSAEQREALATLGRQTLGQLERRRAGTELARTRAEGQDALEALRQSEEFKTRLIESSPDCIKVLDLEGRLLSMNAGGMRTLEICDFGPLVNAPWVDFWKGEDRDAAETAIRTARAGGLGHFVGFFPTVQTQTPMWFDVVVSAVNDADGLPTRLLAVSRDVSERKRAEDIVRSIAQGTAAVTGDDFFHSLVRHVAEALFVRYAFVAECRPKGIARALAFWKADGFGPDFEYDLTGTPCRAVVDGSTQHHPRGLQALFPEDTGLVDWGAESYVGMPLFDSSRNVIGHLVALDTRPLELDARQKSALEIFAARAGAELERQRAEEKLRAALAEVERLKNRLQEENVYLQEEIRTQHNFEEIVGRSPALLQALAKVEKVAPIDSTVLLLGETGTGKELFARAIHSRSARKDRPLVKVNCGAIPAGLVESELFGHVKGAFTGALEKRTGRFELADGGTLFLDEIGELPLETQVKLLRVLQEQEFEAVGSSRTVRVNVRVLAASNRDLQEAVREGGFRADLLYRLNVFPIKVPSLRERASDIPLLTGFFLTGLARRLGKPLEGFRREGLQKLQSYSWPGNVRELQNVVERAAILAQGPVLEAPDLASGETADHAHSVDHPRNLEQVERAHIVETLRATRGVVEGPGGAARALGLHPNTLRSRMKKLGIQRRADNIS